VSLPKCHLPSVVFRFIATPPDRFTLRKFHRIDIFVLAMVEVFEKLWKVAQPLDALVIAMRTAALVEGAIVDSLLPRVTLVLAANPPGEVIRIFGDLAWRRRILCRVP